MFATCFSSRPVFERIKTNFEFFPLTYSQKQMVLLRNYMFSLSLQSVLDAQWLAYQVQMYYASQGDRREEILKTFNVFPEKFDHMTVVKELNSEIESGVLTGSVKEKE